jgi:hypothetical protein
LPPPVSRHPATPQHIAHTTSHFTHLTAAYATQYQHSSEDDESDDEEDASVNSVPDGYGSDGYEIEPYDTDDEGGKQGGQEEEDEDEE